MLSIAEIRLLSLWWSFYERMTCRGDELRQTLFQHSPCAATEHWCSIRAPRRLCRKEESQLKIPSTICICRVLSVFTDDRDRTDQTPRHLLPMRLCLIEVNERSDLVIEYHFAFSVLGVDID